MRAVKLFLLTILFALLANSCNNLFGSPDESPAGNLPAGKGSFSLRIIGAERTIVPAALAAFVEEDLYYELIFTPTPNGEAIIEYLAYDNGEVSVILDVGTYNFVINAYGDASHTQLLFSGTADSAIEIIAGQNTSKTVTLKSVHLGGGTGTFTWDITFPSSVISASMVITNRGTNAPATNPITLYPAIDATTTRGLPSGFYNVIITINGTGDYDKKVIIRREILHVYNGHESVYGPITFTDDQFTGAHTVTLVFENDTIEEYIVVEHGRTLDDCSDEIGYYIEQYKPTADAYLYEGAGPSDDAVGYVLDGWYSWETDEPIFDDITLYPQWSCDAIDVSGASGANEVEKAIAYFNANVVDDDEYTLFINNDVNIESQSIVSNDNQAVNTKLTIVGLGEERKIGLSEERTKGPYIPDFLFYLEGIDDDNIVELVIGNNITLTGLCENSPLIYVNVGSAFTMQPGSKITEAHSVGTSIVWVASSSVKFTIDGGIITGNTTEGDDYSIATVYMEGGYLEMIGGSISGNTSFIGDISLGSSGGSTISGDAEIGKLTMEYNNNFKPLNIEAGWNGSVGSLNLLNAKAAITSLSDAISMWENVKLLQGDGLADAFANIGLGDFVYAYNSTLDTQPITDTHYIADSGADIGKLLIGP